MKRKLKEELNRIATDIITSRGTEDLGELYLRTRELYEKLAVLKFIEEKLSDVEVDVTKSEVASKFETIANAVLNENKEVPESNPHEEDIMVPGMDTIRHIVSEMPGGEELEEVLARLIGKNEFVKNDRDEVTPKPSDIAQNAIANPSRDTTQITNEVKATLGDLPKPPAARSLNDTLTEREISIGLNDRLAFIKHLFQDNAEAYNQALSALNGLESMAALEKFIDGELKPQFNNWEGKEDYELRFRALVERRFN
ncbi:hypothetical protein SAMN04490243_1233 [Robiginitalea myxolifaciens]|uniref:Uncharacterized protein n=1 Tax=Robiginitalea myxolifaciens TaxID=400055 RepID=A0A1I6G4L1_9FLAO|nr:hypothetical protein [Robiginitalea myxolifaciens]SFR37134.1 hypothetical protein SAMN04490243_1233 [Robiginitalea myxolifaciens]